MYWDGDYDVLCLTLRKDSPRARKKHTCCEHEDGKIAIGQEYISIVGIWEDQNGYRGRHRNTVKLCLDCQEDWDTVLKIFHDNGEWDANIVYGELKEAVWDALGCGFINGIHPLVEKWYPEECMASLELGETGESDEEKAWEIIEEIAVRSGLQPALPNL